MPGTTRTLGKEGVMVKGENVFGGGGRPVGDTGGIKKKELGAMDQCTICGRWMCQSDPATHKI